MIGAKYIVVTNGIDLRIAAYDEDTDQYVFLDKILTYGQMIHKEYTLPEYKEEKEIRFTLEELQNQELIWDYNESGNWIFGEDTPEALRSLAVNLYQALLDTGHKLPIVKHNNFELLEDLGQRYMDYGNAGGGHYNGVYRAFLVNDRFGETQIVSLSIFGTDAGFRGEKRNSYTSMTVAIDRFKTSHNSLQYNVDRFVKLLPDGKAAFLHNGQISSMKSDEIVAMVSQHGEGIWVGSTGIELGTIDINKLLYLDDKDVSELIYSFIEYALLREEVRRRKKNRLLED